MDYAALEAAYAAHEHDPIDAGIRFSVHYGDRQVGSVYALDGDDAMEIAIEEWVNAGGDFTEDLYVLNEGRDNG
jgi:hypothetical protein